MLGTALAKKSQDVKGETSHQNLALVFIIFIKFPSIV